MLNESNQLKRDYVTKQYRKWGKKILERDKFKWVGHVKFR